MSAYQSELLKSQSYIAGSWQDSLSGEKTEVTDPARNSVIGTVPNCGEIETSDAISAANKAFADWKDQPANYRAELLEQLSSIIRANREELARIMTWEQGKPLAEAVREVSLGADYFSWYAGEARRVYGETIPSSDRFKRIIVLRQPLGVAAAITPWNFPHAMLARKMAAALAAGCTFIAKPAHETPFSALALGALCHEANFPPGVVNILTGDAERIVAALLQSKLVDKISFTGSTEVGKLLYSKSAKTMKRLTLELGGNAPFVVFEDADIKQAAAKAIYAKYRNAGQTCIAVNRFLVAKKVSDEFSELLVSESRKLHVGSGLDPDTHIGPLISHAAKSKVQDLVQDALSNGAQLVMGGNQEDLSLFMYPTVLSGITTQMRIWHEEIFGPVCAIAEFNSEEEALAMANDTDYGLAAYLFTRDLARGFRVMEALNYGMVGLNETVISHAQAPFGGIKMSGFGREGGHHGIEEYLKLKYAAISIE